jgi:hypothetical protein
MILSRYSVFTHFESNPVSIWSTTMSKSSCWLRFVDMLPYGLLCDKRDEMSFFIAGHVGMMNSLPNASL